MNEPHANGDYERFSLDMTYNADLVLLCKDCGEVAEWSWNEGHSLAAVLFTADAHLSGSHAAPSGTEAGQ